MSAVVCVCASALSWCLFAAESATCVAPQKPVKDESPLSSTAATVVVTAAPSQPAPVDAAPPSASIRRLLPHRTVAAPLSPPGAAMQAESVPVAPRAFIPSLRWEGARPGYVFSKGPQGLGYYAAADAAAPAGLPHAPQTPVAAASIGASSPGAVDQAQRYGIQA